MLFLTRTSLYEIRYEHIFRDTEGFAASICEAVVDQEWKALFAIDSYWDAHLQIDKNNTSDSDRLMRIYQSFSYRQNQGYKPSPPPPAEEFK